MLKPVALFSLAIVAACASTKAITKPASLPASAVPSDASRAAMPHPAVDPAVAYVLGLMPLKSTGVDVDTYAVVTQVFMSCA